MERLSEYLEAIDDGVILAVVAIVLLGMTVGFVSWVIFHIKQMSSKSARNEHLMNTVARNSHLSSARNLREVWASKREYVDVLRQGPGLGSKFSGWFDDERKICSDFAAEIAKPPPEDDVYPARQIEYLKIVDEVSRRPKPIWVWPVLFLMMFAEGYGLSVLLSGYLNDAGSAWQDNAFALVLVLFISGPFLLFAYAIGRQAYEQGYARRVSGALGGKIIRNIDGTDSKGATAGKTLGFEENNSDVQQHQAVRMANRSASVFSILAKSDRSGEKYVVSAHTGWFKIYVGVMIAAGTLILVMRIGAINDNFKRELVRAQQVANADVSVNAPRSGRPQVIDQANESANQLVTQESLEQTKSTKIIVTMFYVLIFWLVQTFAVIISSMFGFASEFGADAYKEILRFRKIHGAGVGFDDYTSRNKNNNLRAAAEIRALAAETLQNWQLGLQSEYRTGRAGIDERNRNVIETALNSAADRTFERYLELNPLKVDLASSPATSPNEPRGVDEPSLSANINSMRPVLEIDPKIEYIVGNASQTSSSETMRLSELKLRIGEAEIDPGSVSLRQAGSSDPHVGYRDFMKQLKSSRV